MTGLQAVIFDMDDTLYPERDFVLSGFAAVAEWAEGQVGIPKAVGLAELSSYFHAGVRGDTFNRWLSDHGIENQPWIDGLIAVYREHTPQIAPYPDAEPTLRALQDSYHLGLITEGYRAVQQAKLEALGLEQYFEVVIIGDEDGRQLWKPDPHSFLLLVERMVIPAESAVYVGDNPAKDFLGARRAGMRSVRLRKPEGLHARVEPADADHAPDYEIKGLGELVGLLASF